MLTLNIDLFNLKMFAIWSLIIFTTIAIITNTKTFHLSFQIWTWSFALLFTTPSEGCHWQQGFKEWSYCVVGEDATRRPRGVA